LRFAILNRQSAIENRKCISCALRYFHDKGLTLGLQLTIPKMHEFYRHSWALCRTAAAALTFGQINLRLALHIDHRNVVWTYSHTGQTGRAPLTLHHSHYATDLEHFLREDSRRSG
jgi:hypothetical protein